MVVINCTMQPSPFIGVGALSQTHELLVHFALTTSVVFELVPISSSTTKNITGFGCLLKTSLSTWVSSFLFVLKAIKTVDPETTAPWSFQVEYGLQEPTNHYFYLKVSMRDQGSYNAMLRYDLL